MTAHERKVEEPALKEGGFYDHARQVAFNMLRSILVDDAQRRINSFEAPLQ
ncbi:MAG TPA: hypothetical protein VM913_02090 [Sphingomicrobium sp.]|jgi:hypothetical protein|nr:hypothetical protein [Sphingomicrobium sp.]